VAEENIQDYKNSFSSVAYLRKFDAAPETRNIIDAASVYLKSFPVKM
jgi:hypothetical protein